MEKNAILIVSHAYSALENRKNLYALADDFDLTLLHPSSRQSALDSSSREKLASTPYRHEVVKSVNYKGQDLFLGLKSTVLKSTPRLILVEYAPWQPLAFQIALCKRRYLKDSKLLFFMKKNTYVNASWLKESFKRSLTRWVLPEIDGFLAASNMTSGLIQDVLEVPPSFVHVVHHLGVDTDLFSPKASIGQHEESSDGPLNFSFVGSLSSTKGIPEMLEAFERAFAQDSRLRLRLLGKGPLREPLLAMQEEKPWLSVESPVPHAEVAAFLKETHAFLFPSRVLLDHQEHDAHALMEAMAVGLPSIVTPSGIIPEIVADGAAILVPERNAEALEEAILHLANAPEKRLGMGQFARERALKEFSLAMVAKRRKEIFDAILK